MKTLMVKIFEIIIISILSLVIISGLACYIQKINKEKSDRRIINYCEEYKWSKDDIVCTDNIYLKPKVKKSITGICHEEDSTYYYRTKHYKIFNSMSDCLESGGRKPYN